MSEIFSAASPGGEHHEAIHAGGAVRLLAALPNPRVYRAPGFPYELIPRSEWSRLAKRRRVATVPVMDQGSHGSCVNHGFARLLMTTREYMGQTFFALSGTWAYCTIKIGYDGGSVPEVMAKWLVERGLCLASECPSSNIDPREAKASAPATARRFRVPEGSLFECTTWGEVITAALMGLAIAGTVRVVDGWSNLRSPWIPPVGRGPGNHVTAMGEGVIALGKTEVGLDCPNSWSAAWGDRGYYTLTEAHFAEQTDAAFYACQTAIPDPMDPAYALWN